MSLIELMIGFLIIGGVTLIYFQTMNSSRKKSQFYSEHFMAALLAICANLIHDSLINIVFHPSGDIGHGS